MKLLKALAVIFILLLSIMNVHADKISIILKQPPPNLMGVANLWDLTLDNTTGQDMKIYLVGTASEDKDGLIIEGRSKVFTVKPGRTSYKYSDFSNAEVKYNNGRYKEIILRTGNAPEGNYSICVTAYEESGEIAGQENCITQSVQQLGGITLISPSNEEELDPKMPVNFTWTPLPKAETYNLRIVELKGDQSPEEAFRTNQPIFEKELRTTSYQGDPVHGVDIKLGMKYAWQVSSGDVKSEAYKFAVIGIHLDAEVNSVVCTNQNNLYNFSITVYNQQNNFFDASLRPIEVLNPQGTVVNITSTVINPIPIGSNLLVSGTLNTQNILTAIEFVVKFENWNTGAVYQLPLGLYTNVLNNCTNFPCNCITDAGQDVTVCSDEQIQLNGKVLNCTSTSNEFIPYREFPIYNALPNKPVQYKSEKSTISGKKYCMWVHGSYQTADIYNPNEIIKRDAAYQYERFPSSNNVILLNPQIEVDLPSMYPPFTGLRPSPNVYISTSPNDPEYYYEFIGDGNPVTFQYNWTGNEGGGRLYFKINEDCGNSNNTNCTYSWSPATNLSNPYVANPIFTSSIPGVYSYTLTTNCNSCISIDEIKVKVKDCLNKCDCGKLREDVVNSVNYFENGYPKNSSLKCNGIYKVDAGSKVTLQPTYQCNPPSCQAKYQYNVNGTISPVMNAPFITDPINFPTLVKIYFLCGDKICDTCQITIDTGSTNNNPPCMMIQTDSIKCNGFTLPYRNQKYAFKLILSNLTNSEGDFTIQPQNSGYVLTSNSSLTLNGISSVAYNGEMTATSTASGPFCVKISFTNRERINCDTTVCFNLPDCLKKGELNGELGTTNDPCKLNDNDSIIINSGFNPISKTNYIDGERDYYWQIVSATNTNYNFPYQPFVELNSGRIRLYPYEFFTTPGFVASDYILERNFCLSELFSNPSIVLNLQADNEIRSIKLNGNEILTSPIIDNHVTSPAVMNITNPNFFTIGQNKLRITVRNRAQTNGATTVSWISIIGVIKASGLIKEECCK